MDQHEILLTSTLLEELILRRLISEDDVFTILSASNLPCHSVTTVLDELVLMLERTTLASAESGPPPIATPQLLIQILTFLLEIPRLALRQLARDLLCHISKDPTFAVWVADCGAVQSLLKSLKEHKERSELMAAQILETLFANAYVAESSATSSAMSDLAGYILDPDTRSAQGKLLATLALGHLFQSPICARSAHAIEGAFALLRVLQEDPYEDDLKVVALCALENLLVRTKEIGPYLLTIVGVETFEVMLSLVQSPNQVVSLQATSLLRLLGSVPELRDDVASKSTIVLRAILAAMKEHGGQKDYVEIVESLFSSFPSLALTEAATSSISQLVTCLGADNDATQECALRCFLLLTKAWDSLTCPREVLEAQLLAASPARILLHRFIWDGLGGFKDATARVLLDYLPATPTKKRNGPLKKMKRFFLFFGSII